MGTQRGILWRLIAQSEPRLAEIICIDILEALPCLQDDASIVEHQPHQAVILCHADIGHSFQAYTRSRDASQFTANADTLGLKQASPFRE